MCQFSREDMEESDGVCSTQTASGSDTAEGTQNNTVLVLVQDEKFWAWQQGTDNATHFKSKENLNFWSERPQNHE
jgi:hypothetical protein